MEFSFSPKLLVVAVAAALPLMANAADTPSTATARKGLPDTITQTSIWLNRRPLLPTT